jgi:outer membrane autotransporter protein
MIFSRVGVDVGPVCGLRNRSPAQKSYSAAARVRRLAALLLAGIALPALSLAATPALADGGDGSYVLDSGGDGGADDPTGPGGDGTDGANTFGGGGGGAGTTGGNGGRGGGTIAGGAGGSTPGAQGVNGTSSSSNGGGGGGGGAHGYVGANLPGAAAAGGNGGNGGDGTGPSYDGGGGGAGGYGAVITGTPTGTISGDIAGGDGGAGGTGGVNGGNGGSGGIGLFFDNAAGATVEINAAVTGGQGGALGPGSPFLSGIAGPGGVGIVGQNLNLTIGSSGTISGGSGANAITLTGGTNFLSFTNVTSGLTGNVSVTGSLTFDQSGVDTTVDNRITGTGSVAKTGTGEITLSGNNTYSGGTTIAAGTLSTSANGNLGASSGALTLDGGTLQASTYTMSRNVIAGAGGGTIDVGADTLTVSGAFSGSGAVSLSATTGVLKFTGNNSAYAGTFMLNGGTLFLSGVNSGFGASASIIANDPVIMFGNGTNNAAGIVLSAPDVQLEVATGTATQSGVISEDVAGRPLEKLGAGTLILSGTNSFTGPLTVSAGALGLENGAAVEDTVAVTVVTSANLNVIDSETIGSLAGAGGANLGAGQTLTTGGNGASTSYSGDIAGDGGLTKVGSGLFELSGDSTYTGPTMVSAGTLAVNGSIVSAVTVEDGATLGGIGSVGGVSILSGGIYAPGNSIGTQTVNGPVSFVAGSFFDVEVDDAGNSDKIEATGDATLTGGTVRVMAQAGTYNPLTDYLILTAASVTGEFDDVTSDMAFLTPFLSYDAANVYLRLIRNDIVLADEAETPNERAVAEALDQFDLTDPLYLAVLVQTADGARQAYDALSGEVHSTLPGILLNDSRFVRDAILSRLQQASRSGGGASSAVALLGNGGPTVATLGGETMMGLGMGGGGSAPSPASGSGLAFWTQGFGAWGDFDGDGNAASADRTTGGFLSGVDAGLGGGWRAGLATGYSQSNVGVDARLSSADVDSYHIAGYAGGRVGELAVRTGGAWTWHDIDTTRTIVFPGFIDRTEASYDGDTGQLFAELALPMGMGDTAIEPFAGMAYVHVNTGGFTESGGIAALTATGSDEDVGYSTLGLRAAATMRVDGVQVTPRASIAWQHAFGDVNPDMALAFNSNGTGFGITGVPIARDSALVEAGLDLAIAPDATMGVSYQGQIASDVEDHGIKGRFDWRF